MYLYAKKNISGNYVTMESKLDANIYNIGTSYYHYCNDYWVLLNQDQINFKEKNQNASVKEVLEMKLDISEPEDALIVAKNNKLNIIKTYDQGDSVNNFIINNNINAWFSVQERLNYKQSIEAAKLLGENTLDFLIKGNLFTITTSEAEYLLAQIQRYADKCYMVTAQHIQKVNQLTTVKAVEKYDHTKNYPKMLEFKLS